MANGYARGQLARAFLTATTAEDPATRGRAERRVQAWMQAMGAMSRGEVHLGSRVPVAGLPPWVTLEVLRGGFATGSASAEGPLEADEVALARRLRVRPDRRLLFSYYATDPGLAELGELLDSGTFRVELPEDAVLLVVAWLARAGDRAGALDLLTTVEPLAGRLRLTPRTAASAVTPDRVFRSTAGQARQLLRDRRLNPQVEAQREAVTVWHPFADQLLALWWPRLRDGRLDFDVDPAWRARAQELVEDYQRLAVVHQRCSRHRRPKENLAILLHSAEQVLSGDPPAARQANLLAAAVHAMVAKRGAPGSPELTAARRSQAAAVAHPAHAVLTAVAAARLEDNDPDQGLTDPGVYAGPVSPGEAHTNNLPAGELMPPVVARVLARARSASVESLIETGVVPSAEVLATLIPAVSAGVVAATYPDPDLSRVMAAHYRAFRKRRSLLLLDLAKQVQLSELPWVRAVAPYRVQTSDAALTVARRVGALALDHFPATILPNPLVRELDLLLQEGALQLPMTEEVAADIFTGRFSSKFPTAAVLAHDLLADTPYARYYDLDVSVVPELREWAQLLRSGASVTADDPFAALCRARAGITPTGGRSVAANGMVLEQAQILTTHNLAALVSVDIRPTRPWLELADRAVDRVAVLLDLAPRQSRPLPTIKDAAYAWRQTIFFLSMTPTQAHDWVRAATARYSDTSGPLLEILGGLAHILGGGRFNPNGHCPTGRRLLGWTTQPHWTLPEPTPRPPTNQP